MAIQLYASLMSFVIALVISTLVIYVATKLFGEQEGIGTALLAAFIGAIIFTIAALLFGNGTLAFIIGGIAWLIALGSLYKIGWLRSLVIAFVIWLFGMLLNFVLPGAVGTV